MSFAFYILKVGAYIYVLCVILKKHSTPKQTMIFKLLISVFSFLLTNSVFGQLSLKNPQICHDKDNFLKCYNDGTYILKFGNGEFEQFRTADASVVYQNFQKTFTFYQKSFRTLTSVDTVQLKLLPQSILIQKGNKSLEITSLSQIPSAIQDFGVGNYSIDGRIEGFAFSVGDKEFQIKIWTYNKAWSWEIKMYQKSQIFSIVYNSFQKNRLMYIFIKDTAQKYGMAIGTTFKTLKKIYRLQSSYVDTMTVNGKVVIGKIPLDKYYYYEYDKTGALKSKPSAGELKLCDCD
jgi:hypothetical protein